MRIMLYYISKVPRDILGSTMKLPFSYKSNVRNSGALSLLGIEPGDTFYEYKVLVDPRRILFTDSNMYNRIFSSSNGYSDQLKGCKVLYTKFDRDYEVAHDLERAITTNSLAVKLTPEVLKDVYVEGKLGISYPRKITGDEVLIYNPSYNKDLLTLVSEVKYTRK